MWCFIYNLNLIDKNPTNLIKVGKGFFIEKFSKRFANDKVLSVSDDLLLVVDGIVLNKNELTIKENISWKEWCLKQQGAFCTELRGLFSGIRYNIKDDSFFAFGNQTGDEPIFYYKANKGIIISSDFNIVWKNAKQNNLPLTFDEESANMMLSHGYLYRDNTFVKEIRKVYPGCMIVKESGIDEITVKTYHRLKKNVKKNISKEDAIELVEKSFTKAVKRCFDKDLEYGYQHLVDISGGLDSRTTNQVAIDMGYKDITNICYAKSGSIEYNCAEGYSRSVGNDFFFKTLDNLSFFYDIDESIEHIYGLTYYFACTGGTRFIRTLNSNRYGLEHSGQIGDAVLGEFHRKEGHFTFKATSTISDIIQPKNPDLNEEGEDEEIHFPYYIRMLSFTMISQLVKRYYDMALVSPFADIDFIDTCLSIPVEMREGHKLYFDWLYTKHPKTTIMPCTTTDGRKVKPPMTFRHLVGKIVGKHRNQFIAFIRKITGKDIELRPTNTMNPFNYWYETNEQLRTFMANYFNKHIHLLDAYPDTRKDVTTLFEQGECIDKGCALTVLAAYKRYFS